jgi:3-carboxy-cis,cis-muconate cycloisomerase
MTIFAFDHPILSALLGDEEVSRAFSADADIRAMLNFEKALASAQAVVGMVSQEAAKRIGEVCADFSPDIRALRKGVAKDGVVPPTLVKLLRQRVGEPHAAKVHLGATSQDVIDTSLVLRLKPLVASFVARIDALVGSLRAIEAEQGATPLMGRTRMQRALPITAADKLREWREPLERHRNRLSELTQRLLVVQFGGPVGVRGGLEGHGDAIAAELARLLELNTGPCWHVERDCLAEFASWLSLVSGSLGKIGQDVAILTQNEISEVKLSGGGASSAMPHKSNPVQAEMLVTLARFNATLLAAQHQTLIHENERSGSAWTLEWLVLPQMLAAAGASLRHASALCNGVRFVAASI